MAAPKNVTKATKSKKLAKAKKNKQPTKKTTFKKLIKSVKNVVGFANKSTSPKMPPPLEKVNSCFNKSKLIETLAERSALNKKQIKFILDEFFHIIGLHVKKGGPEKFVFPGAFKIVVRKIAAKKARNGINPFTGEETIFKAKPASRKIKIIPLKGLKDLAL